MYKTVRGVTVPFPDKIKEGFTIDVGNSGYSRITAIISAESIDHVFLELACLIAVPGFFILEIPTHKILEDDL